MPAAHSVRRRQKPERGGGQQGRKKIETGVPRRTCKRAKRPENGGAEPAKQPEERTDRFARPDQPNRQRSADDGNNQDGKADAHPAVYRSVEGAGQVGLFPLSTRARPFVERVQMQDQSAEKARQRQYEEERPQHLPRQ